MTGKTHDLAKTARIHEFEELNLVVSLSEACQIANYSRSVLENAIEQDWLAARKSAGLWLVSVRSLCRLYQLEFDKVLADFLF